MRRETQILVFLFALFFATNSTSALAQSDYIRNWLICGPFESSNLETECFKTEAKIMPEAGEISRGKEWKMYSSFVDKIDCEEQEAFGPYDNCVGYAYVEVNSPQRRELKLLLGSDDGIKVWLNGKNILTNDVARGFAFDEDRLNVVLEPGWNYLLLKVSDIGGQWCFSARFSDYEDLPVSDLEYRPKASALKALPVKEATASSVEADDVKFSPLNAIDGVLSTRWSSRSEDPQWICLDLGVPAEINRVALTWEAAYAKSYKIEISNDGENWTEVYSTSSGDGDVDVIILKEPHAARYVKLYCSERANEDWGYSLWEFRISGIFY